MKTGHELYFLHVPVSYNVVPRSPKEDQENRKYGECGEQQAYIGGRAIGEARISPPPEPLAGRQPPRSLALEVEDGLGEGVPVVVAGEAWAVVVPERVPVDVVEVAIAEFQSSAQTEDQQENHRTSGSEGRKEGRYSSHG